MTKPSGIRDDNRPLTPAEFEELCRGLDLKNYAFLTEDPSAWKISAREMLFAADLLAEGIIAAQKREIRGIVREVRTERLLKKFLRIKPRSHSRVLKGKELWDHQVRQSSRVAIMLYGLAVENLLKGLIIKREAIKLRPNHEFVLKFHDLAKNAHRAGFKPTEEQHKLLNTLTAYILWRGKYWAPLSGADYL